MAIDDFYTQAAAQLGVSESAVEGLTGGVLRQLRDHASGGDFGELAGAVPGVREAADKAANGGSGGGGLLGGMLGQAASAVGVGGAFDLMQLLAKAGIDPATAGTYVMSLVGFLERHASPELVERLLANVPALKRMLG